MAHSFNWKDAWQTQDREEYGDIEFYELPNGQRIYPGDTFWDTDENYLIEVADVRTKVYKGVVGFQGEEGNDNVFFDADWEPYRAPHEPTHYTDDWPDWVSVEEFAERLEDGYYVPHRGNGPPPLPP